MSNANTVRTTTKNQRGRGRGGQGRNQQNRNANTRSNSHINYPQRNSRSNDDWVFVNDPVNRQSNRGRSMFDGHANRGQSMFVGNANRGRGNFSDLRNKNFDRGNSKRSHSSSSASSSVGNENNLPGHLFLQPRHVNNPMFTELKDRFDSIMPVSHLITSAATSFMQNLLSPEASNVKQAERSPPVHNTLNDDSQTFASISNNIGYGFRKRNMNSKKSMDHRDVSDVNKSGRNLSGDSTATTSSIRSQPAVFKEDKEFVRPFLNDGSVDNMSPFDFAIRQSHIDSSNPELDRRQLSSFPGNDNHRPLSNAGFADAASDHRRLQPGDTTVNISNSYLENKNMLSGEQQNVRECSRNEEESRSPPATNCKEENESPAERRSRISKILVANGFEVKPTHETADPNKTTQGNSSVSENGNTIGSVFLSQLDKFNSKKGSPELPQSNFSLSPNPLDELSQQLEDFYNTFGYERPNCSGTTAGNNQGLTQRAVAGSQHFNINRTVADPNQRTLSRSEALQRNQFEYDIKKAEYEAKEREKQAKKKEEYLARYKHLDLGHRLGEPAGGAPIFASQEEIRQRQQEQLRLDALLNQRQDNERQEHENKKEVERQKWLKRHEHIDVGHRLGHGNTQGAVQQPKPPGGFKKSDKLPPTSTTSETQENPDLLLDGESMEEQLLLETLIYNEQLRNSPKKKEEEVKKYEGNVKKKEEDNVGFSNNRNSNFDIGYLDEASGYDDGFSLEGGDVDEMLIRQQEQLLVEARIFKELQRAGNSGVEGYKPMGAESMLEKKNQAKGNSPDSIAKLREQPVLQKLDRGLPAAGSAPKNPSSAGSKVVVPDVGIALEKEGASQNEAPQQNNDDEVMDIEKEKERLLAQLAMLMARSAKTNVQKEPKPEQSSKPSEVLKPIKPASCVLNNPTSGPVLVLRPSEEDLNEALVRRLEVQDEMDRRGTSAIYKPNIEEKPIHSNNRFERKPEAEETRVMGAIPKQMTPSVPPTKPTALPNKPAEAEEKIDYQAEMRAARLRMQQKYEESLKKQKENPQDQ